MAKLHECAPHAMHPTQITVGMLEVADRKRELQALGGHARRDFLAAHPLPAITGPEGKRFVTDHHHLGRAAVELGVPSLFLLHEAELLIDAAAEFWRQMFQQHWAHPYDEHGVLRPYHEIPHHFGGLRDDIYRSLACFVRRAGGFDKTPTAFAEFKWADFLRHRIAIAPGPQGFEHAVAAGLRLAHSPEARVLPGFNGPRGAA